LNFGFWILDFGFWILDFGFGEQGWSAKSKTAYRWVGGYVS